MSDVFLMILTGAVGLATVAALVASFLPLERTVSIVERLKKIFDVRFFAKWLERIDPRVQKPRTVHIDPRAPRGVPVHAEKSGNGANP